MSYWTFADYPDDTHGPRGINHWGLFRWMTADATVRAPYYSYALLTKFFRGPAAVHQVETGDPLVRAAAIHNEETKTWSVAVTNREPRNLPVSIVLPGHVDKAFRKYVYDTAHVPVTDDGDLQEPSGKVGAPQGKLTDTIAPASQPYLPRLTMTTRRAVRSLTATLGREGTPYRIYQNNTRIGSSTKTDFVDAGPTRRRAGDYSVVDQSGNPASRRWFRAL